MSITIKTWLVSLLWVSSAWAGLGQSEEHLANDSVKLKGLANRTQINGYQVQQISSGLTTINEYLANGVVFAVTWKGMKRPDLSALMGNYIDEYQTADAQQARAPGRHPNNLKTTNLVVRRGGHMRAISGRAYVPALVPSGVNPETLP